MTETEQAVVKVAKEVADLLSHFERKSPAEQFAACFAAGDKLRLVNARESTYGSDGFEQVASRVPQLGLVPRAYQLVSLADLGDKAHAKLVSAVAALTDNVQPLGVGHWLWASRASQSHKGKRVIGRFVEELKWLLRKSPSEEVLNHITQLLDHEHERDLQRERNQCRMDVLLAVHDAFNQL